MEMPRIISKKPIFFTERTDSSISGRSIVSNNIFWF
jgi:hypothetical protein